MLWIKVNYEKVREIWKNYYIFLIILLFCYPSQTNLSNLLRSYRTPYWLGLIFWNVRNRRSFESPPKTTHRLNGHDLHLISWTPEVSDLSLFTPVSMLCFCYFLNEWLDFLLVHEKGLHLFDFILLFWLENEAMLFHEGCLNLIKIIIKQGLLKNLHNLNEVLILSRHWVI